MQILKAQGLPREDFDSLGKVFKREGFVSTPVEERARLMHALSQAFLTGPIARAVGERRAVVLSVMMDLLFNWLFFYVF